MGIGAYSEPIKQIGGGVLNFLTKPARKMIQYADSEGEKSFGGMLKAGYGMTEDEAKNSITSFSHKVARRDKEGNILKGEDGKELYDTEYYNGAAIAGSIAGAGIGYRFLSGGGIYRDKDGNTDIAGIPFV